jgi:hypothetical protein
MHLNHISGHIVLVLRLCFSCNLVNSFEQRNSMAEFMASLADPQSKLTKEVLKCDVSGI